MILFTIKGARKTKDERYANKWVVLHPDNDAILAICDTEQEASEVVGDIDDLAFLIEDDIEEMRS